MTPEEEEQQRADADYYRRTYGSDSYTPEQIERALATPTVVKWKVRRRRLDSGPPQG